MTIATTRDCAFLPSAWLRSFCELTLRSSWRAIIGPFDPFGAPGSSASETRFTASWYAAMARAGIDGDVSFCTDVSIREWITFGYSLGAAPQAGATPMPHHPAAECLAWLRQTAARGILNTTDMSPNHGASVDIPVSADAAANAAAGVDPAFDPPLVCDPGLTRQVCTEMIDAVTPQISSRASSIASLRVLATPISCLGRVSCPPALTGRWLGGVTVAISGSRMPLAYDVRDVGGVVTTEETAYPTAPAAPPSP